MCAARWNQLPSSLAPVLSFVPSILYACKRFPRKCDWAPQFISRTKVSALARRDDATDI